MFGKFRGSRWVLGALMMALLEGGALLALDIAMTSPAQAQFWNDWGSSRRPSRSRSGGFFQNLFGPEAQPYPDRNEPRYGEPRSAPAVDNARAPAPRKTDNKADQVAPTTSIVVMGDGMADWLAYGLEDAFADTPEVAVVRKDRPHSGLLRYDPKDDLDWWHVARDILNQEKATYVVMMLGVSDRQNIRERDLAKEAAKDAKEQQDKKAADKAADKTADKTGNADQPADDEGAESKPAKKAANGVVEFESEQWEKIYDRRIDDTIAALKSKGVPVFWVGLPPIRGAKSTAETSYLNNLYRQRAERAGVVYIDVWDGFVDEGGKFTTFGPDYEGQKRRLRSADGVYFTKYGARKLAHYVEREVRRYMSNRVVALPTSPLTPTPENGKPAARPLAGPVVPLTVLNTSSDELAGGKSPSRIYGDATATEVLVKGDPLSPQPGRADDYAWPPGSAATRPAATPAPARAPAPGAALAPPPAAVASTAPAAAPAPTVPARAPSTPVIANPEPAEPPPPAPKANEPKQAAKPPVRDQRRTREAEAERRAREGRPVPPRNVQRSNDPFGRGGLFGIFR